MNQLKIQYFKNLVLTIILFIPNAELLLSSNFKHIWATACPGATLEMFPEKIIPRKITAAIDIANTNLIL